MPCAGRQARRPNDVARQRTPRRRPTASATLSINAGESPCHTASDMSAGVFRIAAAAAESGASRIHGSDTSKDTAHRQDERRQPERPRRFVSRLHRVGVPRNGSTPARSPASPRRMLASTVRTNNHADHPPP